MSRQVANVDIITDSFEVWLLQTNELLNAFSTEIITANTTYANTGNSTISRSAQLWGTFGANNVVVTTSLAGGNINGLSTNLLITTNATAYVAGADIRLLAGNSTSNSFLSPVGVHLGLGTANTIVNTNVIITQSNSIVNTNITPTRIQVANSTSTANVTAISFATGLFTGNTTAVSVGSNVVANSSALLIAAGSNTMILTEKTLTTIANLTVTNDKTTFSNAVNVTGNTILSNTLYTTGAVVLSNTITVTGNATLSNTLTVAGAVNVASTFRVAGATTLSNTLSTGGSTTFQTDYVLDVAANTNIGATIGAVLVYRFPKATYSSGKFEVQVKNGNTQLSELVLAHDAASNAYVTVYGTVASNGGSSPLGTFTANTDTANVNLYLVQTIANSSVKVIAHLIK